MTSKVLVLLPFYNRSTFLKETISSILNQSYSNIILALINDASTDSSISVINSFSDPRIKLFSNPVNRGPYASLNNALYNLKTDDWTHILLHGSDDVSNPYRIQKQLNAFNENIVAVGCLFHRVDYLTKKKAKTNPQTNESMLLMNRKIFDTIGYFDTNRFGSDTEYKKRILLQFGNKIVNVNEVLLDAYSHSGNLTKTIKIGGTDRVAYINKYTNDHKIMLQNNNFYREFA